ncbi:MAG: hypothetical protein KH111_10715 [Bacteroidales bacterium]|nr:hypothetical protein [Bacteroidales bacterium]
MEYYNKKRIKTRLNEKGLSQKLFFKLSSPPYKQRES